MGCISSFPSPKKRNVTARLISVMMSSNLDPRCKVSTIWVAGVEMHARVEDRNKESTNLGNCANANLPAIDVLEEDIIATTDKVNANRDEADANHDDDVFAALDNEEKPEDSYSVLAKASAL